MLAITLWDPWATAIAAAMKRNETRHWRTHHRGPIAIHAALTIAHENFIYLPEVESEFVARGIRSPEDLAFGCVVATATIIDCRRSEDVRDHISPLERALGNYADGRFVWVLADVVRLPKPIPAKGGQGFWHWTPPS